MNQLSKLLQKLQAKLPQPWVNPVYEVADLARNLLSPHDRCLIERDLALGRIELDVSNPEVWSRWEAACDRAIREVNNGFYLYAPDLWL